MRVTSMTTAIVGRCVSGPAGPSRGAPAGQQVGSSALGR